MPLRLDIKRKLTARSDRVKSVDLHPTEPWMVASLYSGSVVVWNHETQTLVKTFEACEQPVRVARFIARKHWVVLGADDMQIRVFNYNTLERTRMFEAHADYIRCIAVHPTQPYILTSSDDMTIKLWDWEKKWTCSQVFEGHTHYVMHVVFNPKDNNQFASASLDRTIKVWQLGSKSPNFTLEGHDKGVNCVDYYSGGDKPYLISGADDRLVKIWDYQNKTCVQTLEGHAQNVTCVHFHPELPIILTGSEDGTVRVWHSSTYRLENTLNYGMERVWCVCGQRGSNSVALGYDEGSIIIKLGREEPAISMDASGKIMWARHSEVQQANLKAMGEAEVRDGERLSLAVKDMGSCEIYPQTLQHNPNGRFVVVCGDGEYIIYTAMALRNKSFGTAQEFVWSHDSSEYATRESTNLVKIFKNFKEKKAFKPDFGAEGVYGGFLLGVRSTSGLAFFDWDSAELIRRIEIQPKHIFWSDGGELLCIATEENFFVLRYMAERASSALESREGLTEDGVEDAFEVIGEIQEVVKTGLWVGDCFIYTNTVNRLNYYVGGEIVTVAHMDRSMYLLGYIPKDNRLYLGDKELNIISYSLLVSVLEYQTAVMRRDFGMADRVLPAVPKEQRIRVAHFLEKQGFKQQALAVSTDTEHRFELALQLGELKMAHQLAAEAESEHKWKLLAELATAKCQFGLAQECLHQAQDYGGLLLLATASGNADMVAKLAQGAEEKGWTNVAFLTSFLQGNLDKCLDLLIKTNRLPEAAFLARTYLPSHVPRVVKLWKDSLSKVNQKAAAALADPTQYSNLFPGLQQAVIAEQYLKETHAGVRPATEYPLITPNEDRDVLEESAGYVPTEAPTVPEELVEGVDEPLIPACVSAVVAAPPEKPATITQGEPVVDAVTLEGVDEPLIPACVSAVVAAPPEEKPATITQGEPVVDAVTLEEVDEPLIPACVSAVVAAPPEEKPATITPGEPVLDAVTLAEEDSTPAVAEVPAELVALVQTEVVSSAVAGFESEWEAAAPEPTVTRSAESPVSVEEDSLDDLIEEPPTVDLVMVQAKPVEDVLLSVEMSMQGMSLAAGEPLAVAAMTTEACDSETEALVPQTSETITTKEASVEAVAPETIATEEVAATALEDTATEEGLYSEKLATEVIANKASPTAHVEAAEPDTDLLTFEPVPPSAGVEEILPLGGTDSTEVQMLVPLENSRELDVSSDTMPVMEPAATLDPSLREHASPNPTEPEPSLVPILEPEAMTAPAASPEAEVVTEEDPEEAEEQALEMDMSDEGLDDLDLDNFDLDDMENTDINFDDDFLDE